MYLVHVVAMVSTDACASAQLTTNAKQAATARTEMRVIRYSNAQAAPKYRCEPALDVNTRVMSLPGGLERRPVGLVLERWRWPSGAGIVQVAVAASCGEANDRNVVAATALG